MRAKDLVVQAEAEVYGRRDLAAVDRWFAADYQQHSALTEDGPEGVRELIASLPEDFRYEPARVLADGDLVLTHGVYYGLGPEPMVAFDLFRVEDDRIVEHWDALTPMATSTVSGRTQIDGPTEVSHPEQTGTSRDIGESFVRTVLAGHAYEALPDFIRGEDFAQHNPGIGDGVSGLDTAVAAMREQGVAMDYDTVHKVLAEGEFVFTQSEGRFADKPYAYYDLFRVEDGKLVEHWDVMTEIPTSLPHTNGLF